MNRQTALPTGVTGR